MEGTVALTKAHTIYSLHKYHLLLPRFANRNLSPPTPSPKNSSPLIVFLIFSSRISFQTNKFVFDIFCEFVVSFAISVVDTVHLLALNWTVGLNAENFLLRFHCVPLWLWLPILEESRRLHLRKSNRTVHL